MTNTDTTPTSVLETRSCTSCGCTEDAACWPTCTWVAPDLCSMCAPEPIHDIAHALGGLETRIRRLQPHPQRARTHDAIAAGVLRESLSDLGQYRPVIARHASTADPEPLEVLAGAGIVEQAAALGWNHVAVVVHSGIDDEKAARIVAVDNRSADLGAYNNEMLEELLSLIPDLSATGYFPEDLAEIRALNAANQLETFTDVDDVPELQVVPVSRTGDVWLLGPHRLVVGDARSLDDVTMAVGGLPADLLLTDPPYNVGYESSDGKSIANDKLGAIEFGMFLGGVLGTAAAHLGPGAAAYVFHADSAGVEFRVAFEEAGLDLKQVLIWVKDHFVLGRQDHQWQHEPILYGWKPGAAHSWYGGRTLTTVLDDERDPSDWTKAQLVDALRAIREECSTVIRHDRPTRSEEHPTMKPVGLLAALIGRSTRPGGLVLDVCAGSGSTLIACHQLGRTAALVEFDPRYADVICRRWEEHTGVTPVLERTDEPVSFLGDLCGHSPMIEGCGGCDPSAVDVVLEDRA